MEKKADEAVRVGGGREKSGRSMHRQAAEAKQPEEDIMKERLVSQCFQLPCRLGVSFSN